MKKISLVVMSLLLTLVLSACGCKHEWQDANCLSPQVCNLCEETQGEALGHNWSEATCANPKTCSVCGDTEGASLEHTFGDWEVDVEATPLVDGKMVRRCAVCQKTDSKSYELESYIQDNKFIFTPEEFRKLFFDNFEGLGYSKFGGAQLRSKDGQVIVAIVDNVLNNVGNVGFVVDKNTWKMASEKTDSGFDGIVMIISAPEQFIANAIISVIMTCNPTITEYGARDIAKNVLEETTTYKGVTYTFAVTGNYYTMTAVANYE